MRRNGARNFGLFITTIFIKTPPSANFTEKIENKGVVPAFLMIFAAIMVFIIFGVYRGDYIASEFIYKQF